MRRNFVGCTEYCPSDGGDGAISEAFNTRIEARRFAQYSANPRRSLSLQWPIRLPLGAQVLFWTLVKCALEESWLTTLA